MPELVECKASDVEASGYVWFDGTGLCEVLFVEENDAVPENVLIHCVAFTYECRKDAVLLVRA